ncbi:carboxylesterase/lipase family protein [Paractinoplanes atraurantiacus]|uniref:Carboxylic ester hydrolase n=1 Tax=Paractinoplanes atraurantiacus TaxID=1036182 RepID=A0A285IIG6_9ACTN|nr:carboxylesterase family protein [Actinoplanes atraurantiacus]SNY47758.1 para-nitrobenzyl esterase [Actinoplanes atraurantiacus]
MGAKTLAVAALAASLLTGGPAAPPSAVADGKAVVRTHAGLIRGVVHDGYRTFGGVPYAAAPTGERRWRAPQPVVPWRGVRAADAPGEACAQNAPGLGQPSSGAEDCLYADVTTPLDGRRGHPVMVWLHGGGFQNGSGSLYDPHRLAERGVVVVTINYRLGVFGYLGLPGLAGSGTFGLQDQQAALRWVRRNVAAFGGDPGNVTLAGQSAGGMSVCAQLTSPGSAGLFQRAIIQSGSCLTDWPAELFLPNIGSGSQWAPVDDVERAGTQLAATLGCQDDVLACLRSQTSEALLRETQGTGLRAFVDPAYGTSVLPREPADALKEGIFHRMPVLSGSNLDEHRAFIAGLDAAAPVTAERYAEVLRAAFGDQEPQVLALYPAAAYPSPGLAWAAVATDRIWACPTLAGNRLLARKNPVYAYEFAERDGPNPGYGLPWGAFHGAELPYLFDVTYLDGAAQPELAARMVGTWARFAATGRTQWPVFPFVETLATDKGSAVEHHCGFWAGEGDSPGPAPRPAGP